MAVMALVMVIKAVFDLVQRGFMWVRFHPPELL